MSSYYKLPNKKGTEEFPVTIAQPCRVRFKDTEPGTREARALFAALEGEIGRFYKRARLQNEAGIIEQNTMHEKTDAYEMQYKANQGLEYIYVDVPESVRKKILEEAAKKQERPRKLQPTLGIEIICPVSTYYFWDYYYFITNDYGIYHRLELEQPDCLWTVGAVETSDSDNEFDVIAHPDYGTLPPKRRLSPANVFAAAAAHGKVYAFGDMPVPLAWFAGFVAKIEPGETLTADIYMASMNTQKLFDTPPGVDATGSDPPNSAYDWDYKGDVSFTIQAREYVGVETEIHAVNATYSGKETYSTYNIPPGGSPDDYTDTQQGENETFRFQSMNFVTTSAYVAPASGSFVDPDLDGMGELLATVSGSSTVAGPETSEQDYFTQQWNGPVSSMTKIATLEWTPNADGYSTGSVDITLV